MIREPLALAIAALGALALAVGGVALLNGRLVGVPIALCGAALVAWSVYGRRGGR